VIALMQLDFRAVVRDQLIVTLAPDLSKQVIATRHLAEEI
jgi:hypothetical protein